MDELILQSLLTPHAYDDLPRSVRLKQTHISYIFITDNYVYKVKKPVDFDFLNFTTIDRRRYYCEEEVRLNRRLSPEVYLGVVEIREATGGASFYGSGSVIDYAVKMRRLPEELMLDKLVDDDIADESAMLRVASTVARFHLSSQRNESIDKFGTADSVRRNWDDNFRLAEHFSGVTISSEDLSFVREWVNRFLSDNSALFADRIRGGFIRDCHGDLHLGNICLGESVWIFDCIEFNDRFRYLDTASDIAFLLMDLEYHFRPDLAALFLDEYIGLTGDRGSLFLISFYKVYRAFVRGKIASLTMRDSGISESQREASRETANFFFRLARGYILRQQLHGTLIMIGGMIGSGKSTVARYLGRELGVHVLSSDRVRKEYYEAAEKQSVSFMYSPEADFATYSELLRRAKDLLEKRETVIIDATFRRKSDRDRFRDCVGATGAGLCLAMTDASEEVILHRLEERKVRPDRYSDAGRELYPLMVESFEWPDSIEEDFVSVPGSGSVTAGVDAVLRSLGLLQ